MNIFSEISEGLRISWEALRGNLMRSVLTTVGIVIGIVTVTLMATALEYLNTAFRDAISFLGTDVLYVDRTEWFINSNNSFDRMQRRDKISLAQVRGVEEGLSGVTGVAPTVMQGVDGLRYGDRSTGGVLMIGTNEQFIITGGASLASGRFMTKAEAAANRDLCIIGADIADKLFEKEQPLGKRITVVDQRLEVIGIFEKRGSVLGGMSLDNQIVIPIQKMARGFKWDPSCVIQIKVGDTARIPEVRDELRGLMRKIRRLPPGREDDFAINQSEALVSQFGKVSAIIATAGFFITGLSLFVGGIGIMNIMFVSVAERTQEIGVRKALGARNRTVLLQFLIEAAAICLLGGLLAVAITRGLVAIATLYLPKVAMSWSVVVLALTVAVATGLISGFLPAWRAARMRPVDALRKD